MGVGTNWTKQETEYLEEAWGTVSISGIAKKLGRSVNAIKIKAQKRGLSRHLNSGSSVPLHQVIVAMGKKGGESYFTQMLMKAGCPIKRHKVINCSFRVVDIDEFWGWAEQHKRMFDFALFEENAIGAEPAWAKQKRTEDIRNHMRPNNSPWLPGEDDLLKKLLTMYKYTYSDLSKRFNRSEGAIKRRIHDLKLMQRPLRFEPRRWTENEAARLIELWDQGYSYERIADKLGRTALQVRGKHERILKPEMSKRAYRDFRDKSKSEAI